jgi:predicted HicB family RNase H-like nuclease
MKYKGYIGQVMYDDEAKVFIGSVIGLNDIITFEGKNPEEIEQAFKDSVDDYLEFCEKLGEKPQKTSSGKFLLRLDPELHTELIYEAQLNNVSLNSLIVEKIKGTK